jgi:diguanylate cyclase (GGDEF)-like protein
MVMVAGRVYYDYNHYENMFKDKTLSLQKQIERNFKISQENISSRYVIIAQQLMLDQEITKLHSDREREKLYNSLEKKYKNLIKNNPSLYVMHFFDTKNTTVLRMHKPDSFDDDLSTKRPLVAMVNDTKKQQSVFEVGKNGIVYRVTVPFYEEQRHIGVLEFGIKPQYFVDSINKNFKVESLILVNSESLKILSKQREFEKMGEYSVISQNKIFNKISSKIDMTKASQIVKQNGETYIVITDLNFKDYLGKDIAKIVVAKDISAFVQENRQDRLSANGITVTILILALTILYVIFTKYENDLINSYKKVSLLQKKSNYLKNKSNKDPLTKIYNKSYLNKYLKNHLSSSADGSILFFDIDHFKECNDTHGHLLGDDILIKLTKIIQENLRDDDLFARWGGEEFIILLERIEIDKAEKIAEKLRELVQNTKFAKNINITISIGVTSIKKDDSVASLTKRADELLYLAKTRGRNRCVSELNA